MQATDIENDYCKVSTEPETTQAEKQLQVLQEKLKKAKIVITFLHCQMTSLQGSLYD